MNLTIRFRPNNLKAQIDDLLGQIKEVLIAGAKADIELEVICREQRPQTVTKTVYDVERVAYELETKGVDIEKFLDQYSIWEGNGDFVFDEDDYGAKELKEIYGDQIFYADVRWV